MKGEKQVTMKNGRQAISGTCTVCGTKMFKIGGGGGSTAKPLPRIKAASKRPAKKRTNKTKTKAKSKRK
jgi:hypothetical protein